MLVRLPVAFLAFVLLTAFGTTDEARKAITGEWQGRNVSIALKVPANNDAGVFLTERIRAEGPVFIDEVIGKTVRFRIGTTRLRMFFNENGRVELGEDGGPTFGVVKVR